MLSVHYLDVKASRSQALCIRTDRESNNNMIRPRLVVQCHLVVFYKHELSVVLTFHGVVQVQQAWQGTAKCSNLSDFTPLQTFTPPNRNFIFHNIACIPNFFSKSS